MLFARRRWAIRVTEQMDIPVRSKEAVWLIDAAIWGAKSLAMRNRLTKRQAVLLTVSTMIDNESAVQNLRKSTELDETAARTFLSAAQSAALALASEYGEIDMLKIIATS